MPDDEAFDAVSAAAELDAALSGEGSVADLEADLVATRARLADVERALEAAEARADRAEAEVSRAIERVGREGARTVARMSQRVLLDVVAVLDDLDRALGAAHAAHEDSALLHGVELVRRRFLAALAAHDVTPIEAAGERFDPEAHEAISVVPAATPEQDGRVVAVTRAGYRIGDGLLRPAGVVVARRA